MKVSVVIPVYNARDRLVPAVTALKETLDPLLGEAYEILLRDDASADNGGEVLRSLPDAFARVRIFLNAANRGLGFTLRELFREAGGDIVVYCDVDLPFGAGILPTLLKEMPASDIVVASRYKGGRSAAPLNRKIFSRLYYGLCRILFGVRVSDLGSGTVAFRKQALEKLSFKADGFAVHAEIFAQAARAGLSVKEIPAVSRDNGRGSFRVLHHGPKVLAETVKVWWGMRQGNGR